MTTATGARVHHHEGWDMSEESGEIVVAFAVPASTGVSVGTALLVWGGLEIPARPLYVDFCGPESFAKDVELGMVGIPMRANFRAPTPESAVEASPTEGQK